MLEYQATDSSINIISEKKFEGVMGCLHPPLYLLHRRALEGEISKWYGFLSFVKNFPNWPTLIFLYIVCEAFLFHTMVGNIGVKRCEYMKLIKTLYWKQ